MANYNASERARHNRRAAIVDPGDDDPAVPAPGADPFEGRRQLREACAIEVDRIVADPDQPRKEFDPGALDQLAGSLRARGQLQPIRVRWDEGRGAYVVVVGERRWRAAAMAGLGTLACVVVAGDPTAAEVLEDQLVENALREGLKPVEQATAYRTLMASLGLSQRELAAKLHVSQGAVCQALALLDLPAAVRDRVDRGEVPATVAYEVAKLGDASAQADLAARVVAEGLTRGEAAAAVRAASGRARPRPSGRPRVARTRHGKLTFEPRKGAGPGAFADALREALAAEEARGAA